MPQHARRKAGFFKSGPALKVRRNRALRWGGQRGYRKNAGWENRQKGIAHLAGPTPARRFLRTRCRVLKPRGPLPRKPAALFGYFLGTKSNDHPLCKGHGAWRERKGIRGAQERLSTPQSAPQTAPLTQGSLQMVTANGSADYASTSSVLPLRGNPPSPQGEGFGVPRKTGAQEKLSTPPSRRSRDTSPYTGEALHG